MYQIYLKIKIIYFIKITRTLFDFSIKHINYYNKFSEEIILNLKKLLKMVIVLFNIKLYNIRWTIGEGSIKNLYVFLLFYISLNESDGRIYDRYG